MGLETWVVQDEVYNRKPEKMPSTKWGHYEGLSNQTALLL